jgi:O-antigen ligase
MDLTFGGPREAVMEMYNAFAILLFAILGIAFAANAAMRRQVRFTEIDLVIGAFVVWCVAVYLVYIDKSHAREVIKLVFPLFVYVVTKNVLRNAEQYRKMLWLMIVAFTVPVAASTVLIVLGKGIDGVNYWTDSARYEGAYDGAHNLGHNMMFLLMLIAVYLTVSRSEDHQRLLALGPVKKIYLAGMAASGFFGLLMSQTRTQLLGFVVFFSYYMFTFHRRVFYIAGAGLTAVLIVFSPVLKDTSVVRGLLYDFDKVGTGMWSEEELASGRPRIWKHNLTIFENMPIDRQIAGVGIGNKLIFGGTEGVIDSHNDYLELLMHTGVIGLVLYLAMQLLMLVRLLRLPGPEKHAFLGMFIAVSIMNFSSNSYVTRTAIAQLFFLVLTYIELPPPATSQRQESADRLRPTQR